MPDTADNTLDVLLSQRFLPEHGGSIHWMYEVYRRWPRPVEVITHDYYAHPPRTPEFPRPPQRPAAGDHVTDANLRMDRRDIFLSNWGLESRDQRARYRRMLRAVAERFGRARRVRVHCTHAVPEAVSLLPLRWRYGKRLQVVSYAHGEEINACLTSRQLRFLMKQAHRGVDLMLANSDYTRSRLEGLIDPARVQVLHPGVDLAEFAQATDAGRRWRAENGYDSKLVLLTLGRLDPRKNQRAVLQAVGRLAEKHPRLIYVLAGEGRERPGLEALARTLSVADRVIFTGAVDEATRLAMFGGCDLFAMPAIRDRADVEGFGMVFLEAAACGVPSVAGCEGGQAQAVLDGQTGLVVDGTQVEQVTAALDRLLSDEPLRRRLGQAARAHAQSFDWPRVVQRTVELVDRLG